MGGFGSAGEFKGAITAFRSIVAAEGFGGLFAGYSSFLLRDLPFDAIEFFAYETLRASYKSKVKKGAELNALENGAMGACH